MGVCVNVRMSKEACHAYTNKSRRTYLHDVCQLSNPEQGVSFSYTSKSEAKREDRGNL